MLMNSEDMLNYYYGICEETCVVIVRRRLFCLKLKCEMCVDKILSFFEHVLCGWKK